MTRAERWRRRAVTAAAGMVATPSHQARSLANAPRPRMQPSCDRAGAGGQSAVAQPARVVSYPRRGRAASHRAGANRRCHALAPRWRDARRVVHGRWAPAREREDATPAPPCRGVSSTRPTRARDRPARAAQEMCATLPARGVLGLHRDFVLRRLAIRLVHMPLFSAFTLTIILLNCIFLVLDSPEPGFQHTATGKAVQGAECAGPQLRHSPQSLRSAAARHARARGAAISSRACSRSRRP